MLNSVARTERTERFKSARMYRGEFVLDTSIADRCLSGSKGIKQVFIKYLT